ncbi:MAG: protein involved in polysaccharide export with SLBB domain [Paraglaciecola sp.]|jgi:protein involved in polysaccharide export with SLBB domain
MELRSILCSLLISLGLSFAAAAADDNNTYRLSSDDEISVTIFNEPDMSISKIKVGTNGTISMPLLGQVNIKGLTVTELEKTLTKKLLDGYLKKPNVTVSISEYRPFYISGEVRKPGSYPYRKDLTIEKAIALAGGFTERAAKGTISLAGEDTKRNVTSAPLNNAVKPGDVITVRESFF